MKTYPNREKKLTSKILVIGGTGYVGTRLVDQLISYGYQVNIGYRSKEKLKEKSWYSHNNINTTYIDVLEPKTIEQAISDIDYVFYLVHSMGVGEKGDYESLDLQAAKYMKNAIASSNVKKLVYLGGLGKEEDQLSQHLKSRNEVGKILLSSDTETIILRAAVILGSGGTSFEIMRYLVNKLPIMITPKWTYKSVSQPIGIRNVIEYLIGSIEVDALQQGTYDIGGPDIISYNEMMQILAEENGLRKRLIIPVPVLTPSLSARWVRLMTPVDEEVATSLVEGLKNDAVCENNRIRDYIPQQLLSVREAIKKALHEKEFTLIRDAYGRPNQKPPVEWSQPGDPSYAGGKLYYDRRAIICKGDSDKVWKNIISIGGDKGWYYMDTLWKLRGYIDEIMGGPGMRRGRSDPDNVDVGDYLDCWKVVSKKEGEELTLRAEMKIFGIGTLKFKIYQDKFDPEKFVVEQHASYIPRGLAGILYWKFVAPFHNSIFYGMLRELVKQSDVEILLGPKLLRSNKKIRYSAPYLTT